MNRRLRKKIKAEREYIAFMKKHDIFFGSKNVYYLDNVGSDGKLEWASVVIDRSEYSTSKNDKLPWMIGG